MPGQIEKLRIAEERDAQKSSQGTGNQRLNGFLDLSRQ